jgi:hypothetical protein
VKTISCKIGPRGVFCLSSAKILSKKMHFTRKKTLSLKKTATLSYHIRKKSLFSLSPNQMSKKKRISEFYLYVTFHLTAFGTIIFSANYLFQIALCTHSCTTHKHYIFHSYAREAENLTICSWILNIRNWDEVSGKKLEF